MMNGQIVSVGAGRQSNESGDPNQGLIAVFEGPLFDFGATATQVYTTPVRIGGVRIVSIVGTQFLVSPVDLRTPGALATPWATSTPGIILIFDLATRQWITP
jgi:hypothetical protein